jgi:hypothetical protein
MKSGIEQIFEAYRGNNPERIYSDAIQNKGRIAEICKGMPDSGRIAVSFAALARCSTRLPVVESAGEDMGQLFGFSSADENELVREVSIVTLTKFILSVLTYQDLIALAAEGRTAKVPRKYIDERFQPVARYLLECAHLLRDRRGRELNRWAHQISAESKGVGADVPIVNGLTQDDYAPDEIDTPESLTGELREGFRHEPKYDAQAHIQRKARPVKAQSEFL